MANIKDRMQKIIPKSDAEVEMWDQERKELRQVKTTMAKQMSVPDHQVLFSFEPTAMTRTSPFFPMSKRDMKYRPMERGLTWEHSWGRITVSGERLSVYDETVLLSLLYLVKKHRSNTFLTTQYELCKFLGVTPCKNTYHAIWESIKRLAHTGVDIFLWEGKGRNRKPAQEMTGTMLAYGKRDHKTGKLKVIVNPYFSEMFGEGMTTGMDITFRSLLKGDTTKALYRFLQGQRRFYRDGCFEIQLLTLCVAINLHVEGVEPHRLRSLIRAGLKELRKQRYLDRWQLTKNDMVIMWKSDQKRIK